MHKTLKQEIFRQKIRLIHKDAVRKNTIIEQATLYSTFVQPFTDVIDSAVLASQDILNSVSLVWTTFWTLSPEKLDEAYKGYTERRGKIAEKWKPIIERSQDALARGDAGMLLFMANPAGFLATEALGQSLEAGKSVAGYLAGSGIKVPLLSSIMDAGIFDDIDTTISRGTTSAATPKTEKGFLEKLAGLFYIENAWIQGDLILEETGTEAKKNINPETEVQDYLKNTGVLAKISLSATEYERATKDYLDKITKQEAGPKISMMKNLLASEDLNSFLSAVKDAKLAGAEINVNATELEKQINDSAVKLAASEGFAETMAEMPEHSSKATNATTAPTQLDQEENKNPEPSFTEDEKLTAAKKVIFINQKKSMDEQMVEGIDKIKQEIVTLIEDQEPDSKIKQELNKSKQGIAFIKIYDDAKQFMLNL